MCVDVDEPMLVLNDTKPRARKEHKCVECSRTIAVGEQYHRESGLDYYREYWFTYATCLHCDAARDWLWNVCQGFLYEGVLIDLEEHVQENHYPVRTLSLLRLVYWMRRGWRRKSGRLIPVADAQRWAESGIRLAKLANAA